MGMLTPYYYGLQQLKNEYNADVCCINLPTKQRPYLEGLIWYEGQNSYVKLALRTQPFLVVAMQREMWWAEILHYLSFTGRTIPFTSPRLLVTNLKSEPWPPVVWSIFEHVRPRSLANLQTISETDWTSVVNSLLTLQTIHQQTLTSWGLYSNIIPTPRMEYWHRQAQHQPANLVLGHADFTLDNLALTFENQLMILDASQAGWYPQYDNLAQLYQQLYCRLATTDVAKGFLRSYIFRAIETKSFDPTPAAFRRFWQALNPCLLREVIRGLCHQPLSREWFRCWQLRWQLLWPQHECPGLL